MGQQQLLLLVLGIVIVGIAVVAGIQAFSEGRDKAQQDAAISDAMRIISDVQAWMLKPAAFGGGDGADSNVKVSLRSLGYNVEQGEPYATVNGCFVLAHTDTNPVLSIYRGGATEGDGDEASTCNTDEKIADVTIKEATPDGIDWTYETTN